MCKNSIKTSRSVTNLCDLLYKNSGLEASITVGQVFIGECVSARVSYLEMTFDNSAAVKQKCSGLIVSTGTGSTSWTYNVNKLTEQSMEQVSCIHAHV